MLRSALVLLLLVLAVPGCCAGAILLEAENFRSDSNGWTVASQHLASRTKYLTGNSGHASDRATATTRLAQAGRYRVWVRYLYGGARAPFVVALISGGAELSAKTFDEAALPEAKAGQLVWDYLEADLPAGELRVVLGKQGNLPRAVDCLLFTTDLQETPNHLAYGPQIYLRVTLGAGYARPVYLCIFADHYRDPWYAYGGNITRNGFDRAPWPDATTLFNSGERTPWVNITEMVYQDTGARLEITARHSMLDHAKQQPMTLEFATAPAEKAIVKRFTHEGKGAGIHIIVPPDLSSPQHIARLRSDLEIANLMGGIADQLRWPTIGAVPQRFPVLVVAAGGGTSTKMSELVARREWKTLQHFGFTGTRDENIFLPNRGKARPYTSTWRYKDGCFSQPLLEEITAGAKALAAYATEDGADPKAITYFKLMDEPEPNHLSHLVACAACQVGFAQWVRDTLQCTPEQLLVASWDEVRPVDEHARDRFPALYYYSQIYRTVAFSRFLRVQREALAQAYGCSFPVNANFSDGAIFRANFYSMGLDYFKLLENDDQNAIWSEDWVNMASTQQMGAYNVDLMRNAARGRGQHVGEYLIAYAGRKGWDNKLKAVGAVARGAKTLTAYYYGPDYMSHEGGAGGEGSIHTRPWIWYPLAEVVREIGGAEDLLVPAQPAKAEVAILYSSSTDIWTHGGNLAYGFDRMHTWLALAHGQVQTDILSEQEVAAGGLRGYTVCYFSGPNLTRQGLQALRTWVEDGGVLVLTAGAGGRDEYNRRLSLLEEVLPAERGDYPDTVFHGPGNNIVMLRAADTVASGKVTFEALGAKQTLRARPGAEVLATYGDNSPAIVRGKVGAGTIYCIGTLPALAYMKEAQTALVRVNQAAYVRQKKDEVRGITPPEEQTALDSLRREPAQTAVVSDIDLLKRSWNPWQFPSGVRELILEPVRYAGVQSPVTCSVPQIDAVYMTCPRGIVIPLANYTLQPQRQLTFTVRVTQPIAGVETVHQGKVPYQPVADGRIRFTMPLTSTDFIKIYYRQEGEQ